MMRAAYIAILACVAALAAAGAAVSPLSGDFIVEPDPLVKKAQFHTGDYDSSSQNVTLYIVNGSG
jgi:hypothetical protein